jgi:ankyrin repeat protein
MNAARSDGATPLMFAAGAGKSELVRMLLAAGAEVNARLGDGTTALAWAKQHGYPQTAELLRQAGGRERVQSKG